MIIRKLKQIPRDKKNWPFFHSEHTTWRSHLKACHQYNTLEAEVEQRSSACLPIPRPSFANTGFGNREMWFLRNRQYLRNTSRYLHAEKKKFWMHAFKSSQVVAEFPAELCLRLHLPTLPTLQSATQTRSLPLNTEHYQTRSWTLHTIKHAS